MKIMISNASLCLFLGLSTLATADLEDGLLVYYSFDSEGTSITEVNDDSGNGNTGAVFGGIQADEGVFGRALRFDGVDDRVSIPPIQLEGSLSISFWMRTSSQVREFWPSGSFIIDRDLCFFRPDWSVGFGATGKVQFNTGTFASDSVLSTKRRVNNDTWVHVTVTRNGRTGKKRIFLDGERHASGLSSPQPFVNNQENIFIGASVCLPETHLFYEGLIDEVRIYNRILTRAEIQALSETPATYSIEAFIDGRDRLIIKDNTLQWQHLNFTAVGRFDGANAPTMVYETPEGRNIASWIPEWSLPPPTPIVAPESSSIFTGAIQPVPRNGKRFFIKKLFGRGRTTIVQQPTSENDYTLIVEFDDNLFGGPRYYGVTLSQNELDDNGSAIDGLEFLAQIGESLH